MIAIKKNDISLNVIGDYKRIWKAMEEGRWEHYTFALFDRFLKKHTYYIDIGAWIGTTLLYAAKKCKYCYGIEPNKRAFEILKGNVKLNNLNNVELCNYALNNKDKCLELYYGSNSNDGKTSIYDTKEKNGTFITEGKTFNTFLIDNSILHYDFIKMDIEGAEDIIIPNMIPYLKKCKPILFVTLHLRFMKNSILVASLLTSTYKHIYFWDGREIRKNCFEEVIKFNNGDFPIVATDEEW